MKNFIVLTLVLTLVCIVTAHAVPTLDGFRDAQYGTPIATDPAGDLASPGPADWNGVWWCDMTAMYASFQAATLYLYIDSTNYTYSISTGQIGLTIDTNTVAGGTSDPWGNAITLSQAQLPDFCIRGDIYSASDGGWTELRSWNGSDWNTGVGVNWGGISGSPIGTKMAYSNDNGIEIVIPISDIGANEGDTVRLEFFTTQSGLGSKGAYDTVPSDDQSTGWDDPTTQTADVAFVLIPEPTSIFLILLGLGFITFRK